MNNTTQLIIRNQALWRQGHTLFIGLRDIPWWLAQSQMPSARSSLWVNHYAPCLAESPGAYFSYRAPVLTDLAQIVLVLPKSRALLACWLSQLGSHYSGLPVYLVGAKDEGIQRASTQLKQYAHGVKKVDSARHCQLWWGILELQPPFSIQALERQYPLAKDDITITTIPGVFSHGHLDAGTALLLEHINRVPTGPLLDFGCGGGAIGLTLKRRQPHAEVELLDHSAEALYASRISAERNNLDVKLTAADGLNAVSRRYVAAYSNPPFHTGVKTDYSLATNFFIALSHCLCDGGELYLVANRFLNYQQTIARYIGKPLVLAENNQFCIYYAKKHV